MSKYKLAAFDMDGTFLDSLKEIRPSTADACKRASAAGRILAIDTGRAVSELTLYPFGEMGIRYGACTCGTVIYDFEQGLVLAKKVIPADRWLYTSRSMRRPLPSWRMCGPSPSSTRTKSTK